MSFAIIIAVTLKVNLHLQLALLKRSSKKVILTLQSSFEFRSRLKYNFKLTILSF